VLAGENVDVAVRETGPQAPEVLLRFNDTGDLWKARPLQPSMGGTMRDYKFRFENVRNDLVYRFESGRRRTDELHVRVVQRPIVSRLQLRLVPPAYTGRPAAQLEEGRGDAVALAGTRIEISGTASSALVNASIVPDGGPAEAVTLTGPLPLRAAGRDFQANFVLRGDLRYHFDLVDSLGHTNADPVSYQLSAVEDRAPYVEIREPGQDGDLPKSLADPARGVRVRRLRHFTPDALLPPRTRQRRSRQAVAAPQPRSARPGQHRRRRARSRRRPDAGKCCSASSGPWRTSVCTPATTCPTTPKPRTTTTSPVTRRRARPPSGCACRRCRRCTPRSKRATRTA
jgi:hypothetical protein